VIEWNRVTQIINFVQAAIHPVGTGMPIENRSEFSDVSAEESWMREPRLIMVMGQAFLVAYI
jgi:hypothetical protein